MRTYPYACKSTEHNKAHAYNFRIFSFIISGWRAGEDIKISKWLVIVGIAYLYGFLIVRMEASN